MFFIKPDFYDDFKCTAGKCKDNCCIGWEIDVDFLTIYKYRKKKTPLAEKFCSSIEHDENGDYHFKLCDGERCPFLNSDNLCEIIKEEGEEGLCDICREHPRFYNEFVGVTECGLGLCCEEVCRLFVEKNEIFSLIEETDGKEIEFKNKRDAKFSDLYIFTAAMRDEYFCILRKKELSFEERLVAILEYTEKAIGPKLKIADYKTSLGYYLETEPINSHWTSYINDLAENFEGYLERENEFEEKVGDDEYYIRVLAYIIYRNFIKAAYDKAFYNWIGFCIEAIRFIKLCDLKTYCQKDSLTIEDRAENLKNWSKQIEYSEENLYDLVF